MGPPISTWPFAAAQSETVKSDYKKSVISKLLDNFRVVFFNLTVVLVIIEILSSNVHAGPVLLNLDYAQGPVPVARNIRHLPCISRRTGQEGLCMFAIDCLKANGTHLGTCIDRFYFGSCCQVQDKTLVPQITNIDDNTIDNTNFVHPQTEKIDNVKINDLYKKSTTVKPATELSLETKSDELTTIDNSINDEKVVTEKIPVSKPVTDNDKAPLPDKTTEQNNDKLPEPPKPSEENNDKVTVPEKPVTDTDNVVTEVPVKLSTFQTVSNEISSEKVTVTEKITTTISSTEKVTKPTRKPTRPSSFTRPTYKPYNITRPSYSQSTYKPKPTRPISTTRKPPYRLPSKKPSTKKPLPSPPRLNITILPQSSTKPAFTRPSSVSITYINTTISTTPKEEKTTTTTIAPTTTTKVETTQIVEEVTEKADTSDTTLDFKESTVQDMEKATLRPGTEGDSPVTELTTDYPPFVTWSSNADVVTKTPEVTEAPEETWSPLTPQDDWVPLSTILPKPDTTTTTTTTEQTTIAEETTIETTKPTMLTETTILTSELTTTPIPTTTTEKITTQQVTTTERIIETPAPTTEPPSVTESPLPVTESPVAITEAPEPITESPVLITESPVPTSQPPSPTSQSPVPTSQSPTPTSQPPTPTSQSPTPTSQSPTSTTEATTQQLMEFTVNVTLTPTPPPTSSDVTTASDVISTSGDITSTSAVGLTTFTSVTEDGTNKTESNATDSTLSGAIVFGWKIDDINPHFGTSVETSTNASTSVETTTEFVNMTDYKNVCGRRLWQGPTGRIVGGAKSGFGMWPWQISLRQYRTSTYLHKCGAALLNENWAITAAHCVEHVPPSELLVRLGEHDLANEDEPYGFAERRVQIVASHPHFDPATFEYDLALLRFYEPVTFQPNILPVCVPDDDDNFVGRTAFVTGWGRLYDEGPLPSVLQEVKVPVINNSACEAMYQAAGYNEHIPNIFICAGRSKGGTDSCEGDSGGPMVLRRERDGRYVLGGVISWGIGCAEPNQPGVYTRISEFRDWINQILQF